MLVHGELQAFNAGALQHLAQHEHVPERPVSRLHQHAGAQHGVAQRPLAGHDLHLGHIGIGVGGAEGVLDVADGLLGGLTTQAALACCARLRISSPASQKRAYLRNASLRVRSPSSADS